MLSLVSAVSLLPPLLPFSLSLSSTASSSSSVRLRRRRSEREPKGRRRRWLIPARRPAPSANQSAARGRKKKKKGWRRAGGGVSRLKRGVCGTPQVQRRGALSPRRTCNKQPGWKTNVHEKPDRPNKSIPALRHGNGPSPWRQSKVGPCGRRIVFHTLGSD